jgi:hypothetical protein
MDKANYSYAQISTAMANLFRIGDGERTALRGRLQQIKTLGIPEESPGRGKAIAYSGEVIDEMLIVFELLACGLDPTLAVALVRGEIGPRQEYLVRKRELREDIRRARRGWSEKGENNFIFILLPDLLSVRWRTDPNVSPAILLVKPLMELRVTDQLSDFVGPLGRRTICFDLSQRLHDLDEELGKFSQKTKDKTSS